MTDDEPVGSGSNGAEQPASWIFLTDDPASVQLPPSTLDKAKPRRTKANLAVVFAVVGVVFVYVWDDLILAAPIVAVAGWKGPWLAFFVFSTLYGLGSFVIAMIAVRGYESHSDGRESALAKFIQNQMTGRRGRLTRRLVDSGKLVGFVISSIALGAIVTTWLIRYAGRSSGIAKVAASSSLIFGVSFVAGYAGIAALIF